MVVIETFAWNSFKIMREVPMSDAFVIVLVILVTVVTVMEYLEIQGPLFFGSPGGFVELFDPQKNPATVVVDFAHSRAVDRSALQAIEAVAAWWRPNTTPKAKASSCATSAAIATDS